MFWRLLGNSLRRGKRLKFLLTLIIALGSAVLSAMTMLSVDIGEQLQHQLRAYGSNIRVLPRAAALPASIDGVSYATKGERSFIAEERIENIKLTFWGYNIVALAPYLSLPVQSAGRQLTLTGTWFERQMQLSSGELATLGVNRLKSWWRIEGQAIREGRKAGFAQPAAIVGRRAAQALRLRPGDEFAVDTPSGRKTLRVAGVLQNRGNDDWSIYAPLALVQNWGKLEGKVEQIDVSALTTPSNALDKRARDDPDSLSSIEYDTWYCTAYIGSIMYQIEQALPEATATELRQISRSEGGVLRRMGLLMLLLSLAAILCAAIGVSEMVVSSVALRSGEIALMKALGAQDGSISAVFLAEFLLLALLGALLGYGLGGLAAQAIAQQVFAVQLSWHSSVLYVSLVASALIVLLGSLLPLRRLLAINPALTLHS